MKPSTSGFILHAGSGVYPMWLIALIIGIVGTIFLFVHVNLELNSLGKKTDSLIQEIKKYYGIE
jgi:hypothetical protein